MHHKSFFHSSKSLDDIIKNFAPMSILIRSIPHSIPAIQEIYYLYKKVNIFLNNFIISYINFHYLVKS